MLSILDRVYAKVSNRRLFFREGWGDRRLLEAAAAGAWEGHRADGGGGDVTWRQEERLADAVLRRGTFPSPAAGIGLPAESLLASFEMILPAGADRATPLCLHFAATGDEGFSRRRIAMGLPLARLGIGSILLENPYYGTRRPAGQEGKMLRYVSDMLKMGAAAVAEGVWLLRRLRAEGYRKLGVAGISMGGSMAAQAAATLREPLALVCCITAHAATAVFLEGVLSRYLAWGALQRELDGRIDARTWMGRILSPMDARNYPPPVVPHAAVLVGASRDAYIPAASVQLLHAHLPGSALRWIDTGHVGAFLFHRQSFLRATGDAFALLDKDAHDQC